MFLSCKSLKSSVISKVENWKNVNENIKQLCKKGYTSNNLFAYAFGENLGGTMKFVADPNKLIISSIFLPFILIIFINSELHH